MMTHRISEKMKKLLSNNNNNNNNNNNKNFIHRFKKIDYLQIKEYEYEYMNIIIIIITMIIIIIIVIVARRRRMINRLNRLLTVYRWWCNNGLIHASLFERSHSNEYIKKNTQGQRVSLRKSHEKMILLIPEYRCVTNADYTRRLSL